MIGKHRQLTGVRLKIVLFICLLCAAGIRGLDRADARTIPIIALTANAFDEDVQRSLQAEMNAHLSKPVDPDHLFRTLEELVWEADQSREPGKFRPRGVVTKQNLG